MAEQAQPDERQDTDVLREVEDLIRTRDVERTRDLLAGLPAGTRTPGSGSKPMTAPTGAPSPTHRSSRRGTRPTRSN